MTRYNEKIAELWTKHRETGIFFNRIPHFYENLQKGGLLIIGANPSYTDEKKQFEALRQWAGSEGQRAPFQTPTELSNFYLERDIGNDDIEKAVGVQRLFVKNYSYFRKFDDVSIACGLNGLWQHIDLFPVRCTDLKDIQDRLKSEQVRLSSFVPDSVDIVRYIISHIEPEVILIPNAFAAEILRKHESRLFPDLEDFNPEIGAHVGRFDVDGTRRDVYVFYSSMLTQQRALDLGSLIRLQWCMAKARGCVSPNWRPRLTEGKFKKRGPRASSLDDV